MEQNYPRIPLGQHILTTQSVIIVWIHENFRFNLHCNLVLTSQYLVMEEVILDHI